MSAAPSVIWVDRAASSASKDDELAAAARSDDAGATRRRGASEPRPRPRHSDRGSRAHPRIVQLWSHHDARGDRAAAVDRDRSEKPGAPGPAWSSTGRCSSEGCGSVVAALHQAGETEETRLEEHKLDALSEFAAGAGHELNNPLAVIVGRAQLLLSRTDDPETARSLRIMINQAGRAHRILRDLMFVGRPPARRPRSCRPSELLRDSVRDFQEECTAQGNPALERDRRSRSGRPGPTPTRLRHLADIFIRNAVQATPSGGKIQVGSRLQKDELLWWFSDSGRGLDSAEAAHLFDPFYCGRQAGRGLGMGLPRAARIVANGRRPDSAGRHTRGREPSSTSIFRCRRHRTISRPRTPAPPRDRPRNGERSPKGEPAPRQSARGTQRPHES